jgi:hypothetical protein
MPVRRDVKAFSAVTGSIHSARLTDQAPTTFRKEPASTFVAPNGTRIAPSKRKTPIVLTRKEDTKLLQLCLQHSKPDGGPRTTMPWGDITKEFNKWLTRGEVTSLSRHVSKLIKDREMELRNSVIKDENEKDPYDDAIDK